MQRRLEASVWQAPSRPGQHTFAHRGDPIVLRCVRRRVAIKAILVPQHRRARISVDLRPRGTAGQCEQAEHHRSTVVMRSTLFTCALHKACAVVKLGRTLVRLDTRR